MGGRWKKLSRYSQTPVLVVEINYHSFRKIHVDALLCATRPHCYGYFSFWIPSGFIRPPVTDDLTRLRHRNPNSGHGKRQIGVTLILIL